jgi:hypothetical protein
VVDHLIEPIGRLIPVRKKQNSLKPERELTFQPAQQAWPCKQANHDPFSLVFMLICPFLLEKVSKPLQQ